MHLRDSHGCTDHFSTISDHLPLGECTFVLAQRSTSAVGAVFSCQHVRFGRQALRSYTQAICTSCRPRLRKIEFIREFHGLLTGAELDDVLPRQRSKVRQLKWPTVRTTD